MSKEVTDSSPALEQLLKMMACLRDDKHGCPWDRKQSFDSIAPYTIEEAYEVADAIRHGEVGELKSELGDLLFQVVFYAQMGRERDWFDFEDIASSCLSKMIRRHPHVFPDGTLASFGAVEKQLSDEAISEAWQRIKSEEKKATGKPVSLMDGLASGFPALLKAEEIQKKAASVSFDWPDITGVLKAIKDEVIELEEAFEVNDADAIAHELGDVLFSCVNLSRRLNMKAEDILASANARFELRFREMETLVSSQGETIGDLKPEQQEAVWQSAKQALKTRNE